MALQYTYFVEQENYAREAPTRVYGYQSRPPSMEKRSDEVQRYGEIFNKIFNNRPSFGETDYGARSMSQQSPVPSQREAELVEGGRESKRPGPHPRQRVRFVEQREEIGGGGGHKKRQADAAKEQSVDAAADGFITWKHKNLQMCKPFAD